MTSETSITVIEGGETVNINLEVTMPPRFICTEAEQPGDECIIKVETEFQEHEEQTCTGENFEDRNLLQAVVGWRGIRLQNAFCGSPITPESWNESLVIPVRAKVNMGLKIISWSCLIYV